MMPSHFRVSRIPLVAAALLIATPSIILAQGRSLEIDDLATSVFPIPSCLSTEARPS